MKFLVNSSGLDNNFGKLKDPVTFVDSTKKLEIWIKEAMRKYIQEWNKSEKKKRTLANISKIFKGRIYTIKFVDDYSSMTPKSKKEEAQEETEPEPSKAKSKRKEFPLEL